MNYLTICVNQHRWNMSLGTAKVTPATLALSRWAGQVVQPPAPAPRLDTALL